MDAKEILDARIARARVLYKQDLDSALITLRHEKERVEKGFDAQSFSVTYVSELNELIKKNVELNALLNLKDQIENQER